MINRLARRLVPRLERSCMDRGRVFRIYGRADKHNVYLIRSILFKSPLFCIYIHRFMRSDNDRELHDHPFGFLSYVVRGSYTETRMFGYRDGPTTMIGPRFETAVRAQGSLAFRPATTIHRVELDRDYAAKEFAIAPLTVIVRGPNVRQWGFWREIFGYEDCVYYQWVKWTDYLGETEADKKE